MSSRVVRLVLLVATGVAVLPSLLPYTVEYAPGDSTVNHQDKICIALKDAWHADHAPPSATDERIVQQHLSTALLLPPYPTKSQRAAWLAQQRAWQQQPAVQRVNAYGAWALGPGACVPRGRHRLILSGIGVAIIGGLALVISVSARRHRRRVAPSLRAAAGSLSERDEVLIS